MSLRVAWWLSG